MTISNHPAPRRARVPFWRNALGLGLLLALASACGDSQPEPAAAPPAGAAAAKAPAQAAPKAPAAPQVNVESGEGMVPEGFPQDLPLYPDARPSRWMAGEGAGQLVAFNADADPATVYEFFTAKLPGQGWVIETQTESPSNWLVVAAKGSRKARISIASAPNGGSEFGVALIGD